MAKTVRGCRYCEFISVTTGAFLDNSRSAPWRSRLFPVVKCTCNICLSTRGEGGYTSRGCGRSRPQSCRRRRRRHPHPLPRRLLPLLPLRRCRLSRSLLPLHQSLRRLPCLPIRSVRRLALRRACTTRSHRSRRRTVSTRTSRAGLQTYVPSHFQPHPVY